jgi:hypothetical protein
MFNVLIKTCNLQEGNFCDEHGNTLKPTTKNSITGMWVRWTKEEECKQLFHQLSHMELYKNFFFHLLNLTILNSQFFFLLWWSSHGEFQLCIGWNSLVHRDNLVGQQTLPPESLHWTQMAASFALCVCSAYGVTRMFVVPQMRGWFMCR